MKIVVNKDYGGFSLPHEYCDLCECGCYDFGMEERLDPDLIKIVEEGCDNPDLKVIEIPDSATDWDISEYDGLESIVYVVDGKLHWA